MTEKRGEKQNIALIKLNRPKALNALCDDLMKELCDALDMHEADDSIAAIVVTGSERAFAGKYILFILLILIFVVILLCS